MLNFEYLAMGNDNSKQKGVISAENEQEAKHALHKLGLSVLKVTETSKIADTTVERKGPKTSKVGSDIQEKDEYELGVEDIIKFDFSGFDANGEKTSGNIESNNIVTAYKRLVEEFYIDVEWIVDDSLPSRLKESKRKTSINDVIDLAYEQGISIVSKAMSKNTINQTQEITVSKEEQEQMQAEVEVYIEKINLFTTNNPDVFSSVEHAEIKKRKFELEKIKRSNNVFYIQSELNDLIDYLIQKCNKDQQVGLSNEDVALLNDFKQYVGAKKGSIFYDKFIGLIRQFTFFNKLFEKFEDKLIKEISPEIIQQKQRISNYFKQLFYHLKSMFVTKGMERIRHFKVMLKSGKLIISAYRTYFRIYGQYKQQKLMMTESLQKGYLRVFEEIREFTGWILMIYFIALVIFNISLVKGLIFPVTLTVTFMNSKLLISFIFFIFLTNFLLLLKTRYFSRSNFYNFISAFIALFLVFIYFNNY